jgi:hypothetical protein
MQQDETYDLIQENQRFPGVELIGAKYNENATTMNWPKEVKSRISFSKLKSMKSSIVNSTNSRAVFAHFHEIHEFTCDLKFDTNSRKLQHREMEGGCSCPVSLYPWAKKSIYEHSVVGLNQQILDFICWISPTQGMTL